MMAEGHSDHKVYDFIIIGSGIGGGACLSELAELSGLERHASILVLERGLWLKSEKENWDAKEMFIRKRYNCKEVFLDESGNPFTPRMYYYVGGNSKVFGGSAFRFRKEDFEEHRTDIGISPSWPISYDEIAPFYDRAEECMHVSGKAGEDPTEPPRKEYIHAAREHEPYIAELVQKLEGQALNPFYLPLAINSERCRSGSACDGYPCRIKAKHDAEVSFISPLLKQYPKLEFWTDAFVEYLESEPIDNGIGSATDRFSIQHRSTKPYNSRHRITAVHLTCKDRRLKVVGKTIILAAGAINSALLLLRSKNASCPSGLANSSDQVGRNYMTHINSVIMALQFAKNNPTKFQKTLAINDYYLEQNEQGVYLGSIQMRGKIKAENLASHKYKIIRMLRNYIAKRSTEFWVMTEDYPEQENRVYYDDEENIRLVKRYPNIDAHKTIIKKFTKVLKQIGYNWIHSDLRTIHAVQHQCGTIRFGEDETQCPLDKWCKSYEVENLYVVDASVFPSSAALNPALTVAANAMRVGAHIKSEWKKQRSII